MCAYVHSEYQKRYRDAHKEERRQQYLCNREILLEKSKAYNKLNKEHINKVRIERRHKLGINKKYISIRGIKKYTSRRKEYGENWVIIRKEIYKRDSWTCQECGVKCHNDTKRKIQCHHIDYNPMNNDLKNLITLCASCHMKTNFSREDWKVYFQSKFKRWLMDSSCSLRTKG